MVAERIVSIGLVAAALYALAGLVFAAPFVWRWAAKLDPVAEEATWGFRLAILPGVILFWPLLLSRVLRARVPPPDPEKPVPPARLRRNHGATVLALLVVAPIVCGSALLSRPPRRTQAVPALTPPLLPQVIPLKSAQPNTLPVVVTLRTDGIERQVEIAVSRQLDEPFVALYWRPAAGTGPAVFLGSIWGPAQLRFALPSEARGEAGVLTFLALAGEQRTLATVPLD